MKELIQRKVFCQIIEYLNDSNYANLLLAEALKSDPHQLWKNKKVEQTGKPNTEIVFYAFHGVGCSIETKDYQVNFDYNSDGKIRTFNSFMVYHHSEKNKIRIAENEFKIAYEKLRDIGIIKKSEDITGREDELSGKFDWL